MPNPRIKLPVRNQYAVGVFFLPTDQKLCDQCVAVVENIISSEGYEVLGWRPVPVVSDHLGDFSRATQPQIKQCFVGMGSVTKELLERRLYVIRRLIEKEVSSRIDNDYSQFYIPSLSSKTITYKGMLPEPSWQIFIRILQN